MFPCGLEDFLPFILLRMVIIVAVVIVMVIWVVIFVNVIVGVVIVVAIIGVVVFVTIIGIVVVVGGVPSIIKLSFVIIERLTADKLFVVFPISLQEFSKIGCSILGLLALAMEAVCASRATVKSAISCRMASKVMAGVSDVDVLLGGILFQIREHGHLGVYGMIHEEEIIDAFGGNNDERAIWWKL
ncbi:hypothetical protein Tco_0185209 [Tanacetum coccineum]